MLSDLLIQNQVHSDPKTAWSFTNDKFEQYVVALDRNGKIITSIDGTTWTITGDFMPTKTVNVLV